MQVRHPAAAHPRRWIARALLSGVLAISLQSIVLASLDATAPGPAPPGAIDHGPNETDSSESVAPLPGSIPAFTIVPSHMQLRRRAQLDTYLDKTGRRFALLGTESGQFEAWAWPLKLFTGFRLSFFVSESTTPIDSRDIVQRVEVDPAATTITYLYQSFVVRMHVVTAIDEAGAVLLLEVDADHPLNIVAGFIPALQPMWPAGIGGQYAFWDDNVRAYVISESSRRHHAYVGSAAAVGMSYTPAHMLGESPNEFRIEVEDPASVRDRFIPIIMAGGKGERDSVRQIYERLTADPKSAYTGALDHYDSLLAATVSVETPEPTLDMALEWTKISYDNLLAANPDLKEMGLMAGLDRAGSGGRPGFGWFFGGDTYINTLNLNALGMFDASRSSLSFMTQFQREDGKMAHEVTQALKYVDWFGDYPYAYIHADTSPWYIAAVHDHYVATGNREFLETEWPSVLRAYAWCLTTDVDGDGLMDNEAAGLGALEFGSMTDVRTDIYLGAVWTRALQVLPELARAMDDAELADEASAGYEQARTAFERFWSEETLQYSYAFDDQGKTLRETTPWPSVGMLFGYGRPERRRTTMQRLARSDMTTDWGIRMLSSVSDLFEPLNYNYGAVWPFVTGWATMAHFWAGQPVPGYSSLMSTVQHIYGRSLGNVQEVMSGSRHSWPAESVPHQGFALNGIVLPTIRGLFGLFYDAPPNVLTFAPQVPEDWNRYEIHRFRYGNGSLDINVRRENGLDVYQFTPSSTSASLAFRPLLPPGTRVAAVRSGSEEIEYTTEVEPGGIRLYAAVALSESVRIEVAHSAEPMIVPPIWDSQPGSESRGVRVLSYERDGLTLEITVEGRPGRRYDLGIANSQRVATVEGAEWDGMRLSVTMPASDTEHITTGIRVNISPTGDRP